MRESTVPHTIQIASLPQCKSPYGQANMEIDSFGVQGIPLTMVQCASAQKTTALSKVHSFKLPNKSKKTKTNQVGGVSSIGRGSVAIYSGEPLVPRGVGDKNCASEENTNPLVTNRFRQDLLIVSPNRGAFGLVDRYP